MSDIAPLSPAELDEIEELLRWVRSEANVVMPHKTIARLVAMAWRVEGLEAALGLAMKEHFAGKNHLIPRTDGLLWSMDTCNDAPCKAARAALTPAQEVTGG